MTTDIVRHDPSDASSLPEKMDWARALATSTLLPAQYRNNPGNLLFAVEYADALGVSRINAITSIHVIEGKPSASADLIASLVRRAGHRLRVLGDDTFAEAHLIRADDPEFTYKARWDMDKARAANLLGKGVWRSYPGAMLRSRAITEVARMGASDALFGVIYTPEELGAEVDPEGDVVHNVTQVRAGSGADRAREVLRTQAGGGEGSRAEAPVAETVDSSPAGDPSQSSPQAPEGITAAQIRKLAVSMNELGLTDRDSALAYVADVIGRQVDSRNDLTKDEASRVIDALERDAASNPAVVDAEVVEEPTSAPATEPTGDPDAIWQQILTAGGTLGWDLDRIASDFRDSMGMIPDEASAAELSDYLRQMRTGEQVPA